MFRGTVVLIALLALVVAAPAAAVAGPTPGALDPAFGTGGIALGGKGLLSAGAYDDDGRIVTAGMQTLYSSGPILAQRWTVDGQPDPTFGSQGTATFARPGLQASATVVATAPDGSVYVGGGGNGGAYVVRLTPSGTVDTTFGSGGFVELEAAKGGYVWGMVRTPSGLVVAYAPFGSVPARVVRLTASGALDPSFSGDGLATTTFDPATLPPAGASGQQMLIRRADGTLLLGGVKGGKPAIAAFDDAGAPLAGFGTDGVAQLPTRFGYGTVTAIAEATDGAVLALSQGAVMRLSASGVLDTGFGAGGQRVLELSPTGTNQLTGLVAQPDGGVLVAGATTPEVAAPVPAMFPPAAGVLYVSASSSPMVTPDLGVKLARLTSSGAIGCDYGSYGYRTILPEGTFGADAQTVLLDGDGRAVTVGTARGPDYNAMTLLTRTETAGITVSLPVVPWPTVQLLGLRGYGYQREPVLSGWIDSRCMGADWHFEYGTTTAYGSSTPTETISGDGGPASVTSTLSGLGAGTYHYRLVVTNSGPGPSLSEDQTFTLKVSTGEGYPGPKGQPTATTGAKAGRLRLLSSRAALRSGKTARFAVRCRDGACKRGTMTLRRVRTTIGAGTIALSAGKKGYVTVRLNAAGRRAAARHRSLKATATLAVKGGKAEKATVTISSPRAKKKATTKKAARSR